MPQNLLPPPPESAATGSSSHRVRRRGIEHGVIAGDAPEQADAPSDLSACWRAAEPILLPGILQPALAPLREWIEQSEALFAHFRAGGRFLDAVLALLEGCEDFRPEGSTVDKLDAREIEKVFVSGLVDGKRVPEARDLWLKLTWLSDDERDESARIRFSVGTERLQDWHRHPEASAWSDRLAEQLFPECAAIAGNGDLMDLIASLVGNPVRVSERILYSNAPGGGAVFHHDAEPTQRGVVYGQLSGATAWLALPKRELARHVAAYAKANRVRAVPTDPDVALRALDEEYQPALFALINETPEFTRRLADAGWLQVVEAGDALLLPSPGFDVCAWHSVFALGDSPSLSHSYGIFDRR
jgi:hypothetical protein